MKLFKHYLKNCRTAIVVNGMIAILLTIFLYGADENHLLLGFTINLVFSNCIGFSIMTNLFLVEVFVKKSIFSNLLRFVSVTIAILWGTTLAILIINSVSFLPNVNYDLKSLFIFNLGISFIFTIVAYYIFHLSNKYLKEKIAVVKEKQLRVEAELSSLKTKINPHFLFNTLNSISALIDIDAKMAESTVNKLSELLRFTLRKFPEKEILLSEEIYAVETYLNIEKVRFGERLDFKIEFPENIKKQKIPPSIILNLVENSIKHGLSQKIGKGTVDIKILEKDKNINIRVKDNGNFTNPDFKKGFGTTYISEILSITYKNKAKFSLKSEDGCLAEIVIPYNEKL